MRQKYYLAKLFTVLAYVKRCEGAHWCSSMLVASAEVPKQEHGIVVEDLTKRITVSTANTLC